MFQQGKKVLYLKKCGFINYFMKEIKAFQKFWEKFQLYSKEKVDFLSRLNKFVSLASKELEKVVIKNTDLWLRQISIKLSWGCLRKSSLMFTKKKQKA